MHDDTLAPARLDSEGSTPATGHLATSVAAPTAPSPAPAASGSAGVGRTDDHTAPAVTNVKPVSCGDSQAGKDNTPLRSAGRRILPVEPKVGRREDGRTDHMAFRTDQIPTGSDLMRRVLDAAAAADFDRWTETDVRAALTRRGRRTRDDLAALLSPAAAPLLEEIARAARGATRERFGTSIQMFTPLYIANHCANICTYCGFSATNRISRVTLTGDGVDAELRAIAATGLQEVLILTGESTKFAGTDVIVDAVARAARYFSTVGIEVQPLSVEDYRRVHEAGCDFVSVYQETYDSDAYDIAHPAGHKRQFPYRFESQERALLGGMDGVNVGALLGLSDFRRDAFAAAVHADELARAYPHASIGFSVPRLRPILGGREPRVGEVVPASTVRERELLQVMCAYRLFLPEAGITISTRERAAFRDNVLGVVANKASAGVSTGVGEHAEELADAESGDAQFDISDERDVPQMISAIQDRGLQPVVSDHVRLTLPSARH